MPVVTKELMEQWQATLAELLSSRRTDDVDEKYDLFSALTLLKVGQAYDEATVATNYAAMKQERLVEAAERAVTEHSSSLWREREAKGVWRPCASCGKFATSSGRADDEELDNALCLSFSGGYGLFIDDEPKTLLLCHECAHEACDKLPWLSRLLTPANSHSHTEAYAQAHPDHFGWDYSRRAGTWAEEKRAELFSSGACATCSHSEADHELNEEWWYSCMAPSCLHSSCYPK